MNALCTLLAFGFWGLHCLSGWPALGTAALMGLFLYVRFERKRIVLIWALLSAVCLWNTAALARPEQPEAGEYTIVSIRPSYVLAQKEKLQVVVYGIEEPRFGQSVELSDFETIHSLQNPGQYSFMDSMAQRGIYFQTRFYQTPLMKESGRLDFRIRNWLLDRVRSSSWSSLLGWLLYGWSSEELPEWSASLGLPFAGFLQLFCRGTKRWLNPGQQNRLSLLLCLLHGVLTGWSISTLRLLVWRLVRPVSDFEMPAFLGRVLLVLLLVPWAATSFAFVLPVVMELCRIFFAGRSLQKKAAQKGLLFMLQGIWFGSLSLSGTIGYGLLRPFCGLLYLCGWLLLAGLSIPIEPLLSLFVQTGHLLMQVQLQRYAPLPILVLFCISIALLFWRRDGKGLASLFLALLVYVSWPWLDPCFHVYQIDVGQADCAVVVAPSAQSTMLIDAPSMAYKDMTRDVVVPFLKQRGIDSLDVVVITHADEDHAGGKDSLLEEIEVRQIIEDCPAAVDLDFDVQILQNAQADSLNEASLVTCFGCDGWKYLWMGDAGSQSEKVLLQEYDLDSDILKVGHHGSLSSSSTAFLRAVQPQIALISCGYANRYGHPNLEVLQRMKQAGINVLRTDTMGMLHLASWGPILFVESGSGLVCLQLHP